MILGLLVLVVIAGIIYYSIHKIPPEPIFREEVYVEEEEFWDDMREDDFKKEKLPEVLPVSLPFQVNCSEPPIYLEGRFRTRQGKKKPNLQKRRQGEKDVQRRRKRRKIAKRSRQQNRR